MKKSILFLMFCLITSLTFSQDAKIDKAQIENEVNEQVWKPFKAAFESRDWKHFNELHTDDILRVSKWGIQLGPDYKQSTKERYQRKSDVNRTIDFWLEHRIYSGEVGYEVGYYRITSEAPGKEARESFARFHIVLKKVEGKWKIAQDWDVNEINGIVVSEKDFAKGIPLEL